MTDGFQASSNKAHNGKSNRCYRAPPRGQGREKSKALVARRQIAVLVFERREAIDIFLQRVAKILTDYSEQQGLGVTLIPTMNSLGIGEQRPGARVMAEENDPGMVGEFLRAARREGLLSANRQVVKAVRRREGKERNSAIRKHIRDRRNSKAEVLQREDQHSNAVRFNSYRKIVDGGRAFVDQGVRATIDCKDVAVDAPVDWSKGVPMPIVGSQVFIDREYSYKKRKRAVSPKG